MAILRRQLRHKAKGSLLQNDDWWRLCYDTESREFYIEHEWHHVNPYKLSEAADEGREQERVEGYHDDGAEKIEQFKAELLAEAKHA